MVDIYISSTYPLAVSDILLMSSHSQRNNIPMGFMGVCASVKVFNNNISFRVVRVPFRAHK